MKSKYLLVIIIGTFLIFPLISNATRYKPFNPFKYEIQEVAVSGELKISTLFNKYLIKDGQKIYLYSDSGTVLSKEGQGISPFYQNSTLLDSNKEIGKIQVYNINLSSETPNIEVCYYADSNNVCGKTVSFETSSFSFGIKNNTNLEILAKAKGALDKDAKTDLLQFQVRGDIGGDPFSLLGKYYYDNTQGAKDNYARSIWFAERGIDYVLVAILIIILLIILLCIFKLGRFVAKKIRSR